MSEARFTKPDHREHLPAWIQEVHSFQGLTEAIKNPSVNAAFFVPQNENRKLFERFSKKSWSRESHYVTMDGFDFRYRYKGRYENLSDEELNILRTSIQEDISGIERTLGEYEAPNLIRIERGYASTENELEEVKHQEREEGKSNATQWHRDGEGTEKREDLRFVRTYFGKSIQFAFNEDGESAVNLPDEAISVHRASGRTLKKRAVHRRPPIQLGQARCVAVFDFAPKN